MTKREEVPGLHEQEAPTWRATDVFAFGLTLVARINGIEPRELAKMGEEVRGPLVKLVRDQMEETASVAAKLRARVVGVEPS